MSNDKGAAAEAEKAEIAPLQGMAIYSKKKVLLRISEHTPHCHTPQGLHHARSRLAAWLEFIMFDRPGAVVQVEDDNPYASLEKKSKKGRKAEKSAAKVPAEKPLNHTFDILSAFGKLKIEAPLTASKVRHIVCAMLSASTLRPYFASGGGLRMHTLLSRGGVPPIALIADRCQLPSRLRRSAMHTTRRSGMRRRQTPRRCA